VASFSTVTSAPDSNVANTKIIFKIGVLLKIA